MHHLDPSFHPPSPTAHFQKFLCFPLIFFSQLLISLSKWNGIRQSVSGERPVREAAQAIVSQLEEKWGTEGPPASVHARARNSREREPEQDRTRERSDSRIISYLPTSACFKRLMIWPFFFVFFLNHMWMRRLTGRAVNSWIRWTSGWRIRWPGRGRIRRATTHPGPGSERN